MKQYWLGLDIGGTKCAVLLASLDRGIHLKDKIRFATCTEKGFDYSYGKLCESMEELLQRNDLTFAEVSAIGISCGGPLDSRKGVILCPPNLPGWVNVPLPAMLTEKYGVPAYIQNDANACALVEWKLGAGRGTENMIFLTMGTGMGGGVIAEGQLLRGHTDMGGEIGHLRLTEDGPVGFGKAGSFEGYSSGGGIGRQAQALTEELIAAGKSPAWARESEISAKTMADYARKGDKDALAFWDHIGDMLGRGLALLVDSFNPECIVIGSIFVRCEDLLRPSMEKALKEEAIPFSLEGLRVVPAQTGEALGDLASIMVALHEQGIDPLSVAADDTAAMCHYHKLLEKYPALYGCKDSILEAYSLLKDCYERGGKVLVAGNGGSCADAEHIVGELMKGFYLKRPLSQEKQAALSAMNELLPGATALLQKGLPAIALTGHNALTTAVGNDLDPLLAVSQQLLGYGRAGDVFIGISTSGNAKNVALAAMAAKAGGIKVIGLSGGSGGRLSALSDCLITVPGGSPAEVQEYHLPVYHCLCTMLEAHFFTE